MTEPEMIFAMANEFMLALLSNPTVNPTDPSLADIALAQARCLIKAHKLYMNPT